MAIKGDLLDLRPVFEARLVSESCLVGSSQSAREDPRHAATGSNRHSQHARIGAAFGAFRYAFGRARVALLHTRLAPRVCDAGSYSQLLYGCCLSLLRDALEEREKSGTNTNNNNDACHGGNNDDTPSFPQQHHQDSKEKILVRAAYATFLLYALHETNPLKHVNREILRKPGRNDRMIALLPTSLSCSRDTALFRRAFHGKIRVDPTTYGLLMLVLRDLALEAVARCHASQFQDICLEEDGSHRNSGGGSDCCWRCTCAVAQDVLHVLRRLESRLDLASYTGPCGLEGMAGHPDYPWRMPEKVKRVDDSLSSPGALAEEETITMRERNIVTDDEAQRLAAKPTEDLGAFMLNKETLERQTDEYISLCLGIRFPVKSTPLLERVRKAIRPVFEKAGSEETPVLSQLLRDALHLSTDSDAGSQATKRTLKSRRRRHVTFAIAGNDDNRPSHQRDGASSVLGSENGEIEQHSIHEQNQERVASHELVMPDGLSEMQEESLAAAVECLLKRGDVSRTISMFPTSASTSVREDDVSTLGDHDGLHSDVRSRVSGVGRSALMSLLSQAVGSPSDSLSRLKTGDLFLDASIDEVEHAKTNRGLDEDSDQYDDGEMSDLSDDALSITASAVGRRALDELISKSAQSGTASIARTRQPRKPRSKAPKPSPKKKPPDATKNVNESDSDDIESHLPGDASTVASAVGRTALKHLLTMSHNARAVDLEDDCAAIKDDSEVESINFFQV
jgi:hypothetical protein